MQEIRIAREADLSQARRKLPFWGMPGRSVARLFGWMTSLVLCANIAACASSGGAVSAADALPVVIAPPAIGSPMSATVMPLQASGYVEEEYFIQGQANRYRIKDPMRDAQQIDSNNPYETRVLVRRPTDAARFNGTVIVEWLNVSLDQDIDFVFGATRELLVRDGYAWIGVSAQRNGVAAMKKWNSVHAGRLRKEYQAVVDLNASQDHAQALNEVPGGPLRRSALSVARRKAIELRNQEVIGDPAYRALVQELDWAELAAGATD